MHKSCLQSLLATAFLRESQIPGAVRWTSGSYTYVAVLPRVQSSHGPVREVASMNMGELLTSLSSDLATTLPRDGGSLRVPLGGLWVFDGAEIGRRYEIGLTLSDKQG